MSEYLIWGSELSPFTLKLRALMECAQIPYRSLPADGSRVENLRLIARLARGKRHRSIARSGGMSELGEYPSVPFLIEDNDRIQYDSSALAHWLDEHPERKSAALFPEEPKAAFLAQLIDECFDEFGLYMVHHQRWVHSAATNDAGARLAAEFRSVIPVGLRRSFAGYFSRRQVRRLPYLFSVAPEGLDAGVSGALTPPSHGSFPATHDLLDRAWRETVDAVEAIFSQQPFLLGDRFTVADASVYGELGMNLKDASTAEVLCETAPNTYIWLCRIHARGHIGCSGEVAITPLLEPLLRVVTRYFVPLMQQNAAAYSRTIASGEHRFNEAAFDLDESLYEGEVAGFPFRAVVKTFQVEVWNELCRTWQALEARDRAELRELAGDGLAALDDSAVAAE